MKKVLLVLTTVAFLTAVACTNRNSNNSTETAKPKEEHKEAIFITKKDFLEKVWDYESNPDEWIYKGDKPCVIDFTADWCSPCKRIAPVLEELAVQYKGEIYVYKIDVEKEKELGEKLKVKSIPLFLFCPMKGKYQDIVGVHGTLEETKDKFEWIINQFLLGK